jgi:hypothetical protein
MPTDHNPQARRGHFHRGRRGPDRRGPERRQVPPPDNTGNRGERVDRVDVEQIMRDIRARISQRSGVELSNQQIQELAARRLEAILDPRGLNPALLEQLRRGAGERTAAEPSPPDSHPFDEASLYDSPNGLLRFLRRLLNPILRLFINPTPIAHALALQSRLSTEVAGREAERDRRQSEWNALHYQILQRLATEVSRISIEAQSQALRIESLGAKVDFNERRVRTMEGTQVQGRSPRPQQDRPQQERPPQDRPPQDRTQEERAQQEPASTAQQLPALVSESGGTQPSPISASAEGTPTGDAPRRRRRRRRGRRSSGGGPPADATQAAPGASAAAEDIEGDSDEGFDDESGSDADSGPGDRQAQTAAQVVEAAPEPTARVREPEVPAMPEPPAPPADRHVEPSPTAHAEPLPRPDEG